MVAGAGLGAGSAEAVAIGHNATATADTTTPRNHFFDTSYPPENMDPQSVQIGLTPPRRLAQQALRSESWGDRIGQKSRTCRYDTAMVRPAQSPTEE
ncbi:hypothetical protein AYK61_17435 [Rhodococcus sp. SBT000017]|nr:hypothetical protein AYK61_17435 [Rhodococcus sp. SBT000017]